MCLSYRKNNKLDCGKCQIFCFFFVKIQIIRKTTNQRICPETEKFTVENKVGPAEKYVENHFPKEKF